MRTRVATFTLDARGFVLAKVDDHAEMKAEDARDALDAIRRVGGPERCPTLVDMRRVKSISSEGRDYFRTSTLLVCSRVAMLVGSPVGRVIGNFFFRTSSGGMPKKIFNDEADAVRWLLVEP